MQPQPNRKTTAKGQAGQEGGAPASKVVLQNIRAVCELEQKALDERSWGERIGDGVSHHAGRAWFIVFHLIWFATWIILNAGLVPVVPRFDPYPYPFLTFAVSLEAIFLSLFILMSQNRSNRQADARSHLDLQINLLAEQESTKMLQMLQSLCTHHKLPIAEDFEVENLKLPTHPDELLKELNAALPDRN